jgi:hypothetical protein
MLAHGALLGWSFSTIRSLATETTFSQKCKRGTKRNNVPGGGARNSLPGVIASLFQTFRACSMRYELLPKNSGSVNNFIQTAYWLQTIFAIEASRKPGNHISCTRDELVEACAIQRGGGCV